MPKPRTNEEAVQYWADSIREREPRASLEVNSIIVRNDVVFSFGSHYPMGVIQRAKNGRAIRVVITTDRYPSRGWANTPGDQYNVDYWGSRAAEGMGVPIARLPLSDYSDAGIRVRPNPDDPEPPAWSHVEVPFVFHASDPGPEPAKDPDGCIAGRVEEFEAQGEVYLLRESDLRPTDFPVWHRYTVGEGERKTLYARRATIERIEWGAQRHAWDHYGHHQDTPANTTYKQCPHCAAFDVVHEAWHVRMHGERWGRGRNRGWSQYCEQMARYGSEEAWREARRRDLRRVRRERAERKAWVERNYVPLSALSVEPDRYPGFRHRVPILRDGYPLQRDVARYFIAKRRLARERARAEREHQRRLRQLAREQVELARFKERTRHAQRTRGRRRFELMAAEVAGDLAQIRANIERQSEESEVA